MEGRTLYVLTALQILGMGVVFWVVIMWNTPWNAMRYIGTILVVVGVGLHGVARFQLGKSFSAKAKANELVTHGLYSKIRNPIYVFSVVMVIGLLLVLQIPALWIILVPAVIPQVIRARREARVLETAFGDSYREYRSKTWF